MDFTNWLSENDSVVADAAGQAFGLRDFVRMSGNGETSLYASLDKACEEFHAELVKRGRWEDFADDLGLAL